MLSTLRAAFFLIIAISFAGGCAQIQKNNEADLEKAKQAMEANLSKGDIGLHVRRRGYVGEMTKVDLIIRNNTGKFISNLYLEVYPYFGETRVGMGNCFINSLNVGETIINTQYLQTSGRPWDGWKWLTHITY